MKRILLLATALLSMISCHKGVTIQTIIADALGEARELSPYTLVLYISERMCSTCINEEIINIRQNSTIENKIIVVGVFSNKRNMYSTLNDLDLGSRAIFVDAKKVMPTEEKAPQYFIYNKEYRVFSAQFVPSSCNPQKTMDYYEDAIKIIQND
jgi:hypothetical protein